nr:MAG TPA: hypothetical protein [Caudoviricetes sp.]
MNTTIKKCVQWCALSSLCIVGFFAFILFIGDEDPRNPISLTEWMIIKFLAFVVLALCILAGRWLYNLGYLPRCLGKLIDEEF